MSLCSNEESHRSEKRIDQAVLCSIRSNKYSSFLRGTAMNKSEKCSVVSVSWKLWLGEMFDAGVGSPFGWTVFQHHGQRQALPLRPMEFCTFSTNFKGTAGDLFTPRQLLAP